MKRKVAVIVGSLRKDSWNKKVAETLMQLSSDDTEMKMLKIGDLPLYNSDLDDENPPKEWVRFRNEFKECDSILFASPEYNRSISGAIKNAIDVASRPMKESVITGKPAAIISCTYGGLGAFGSNHILRQSMVFLNVPVMQQPEAYISNVASLFDESGNAKPDFKEFLQKFIDSFEDWIRKF